jgi:hypothetical protein
VLDATTSRTRARPIRPASTEGAERERAPPTPTAAGVALASRAGACSGNARRIRAAWERMKRRAPLTIAAALAPFVSHSHARETASAVRRAAKRAALGAPTAERGASATTRLARRCNARPTRIACRASATQEFASIRIATIRSRALRVETASMVCVSSRRRRRTARTSTIAASFSLSDRSSKRPYAQLKLTEQAEFMLLRSGTGEAWRLN